MNKKREIVLDASVLSDIFIKSRKRHKLAMGLAKYIKTHRIKVTIPMHAILELKCAIDNERLIQGRGKLAEIFPQSNPLEINIIAIDEEFIHKYYDLDIPYIKAGDLIYILIAKKHHAILITEDKKQAKVAKSINVETYDIEEFLTLFS